MEVKEYSLKLSTEQAQKNVEDLNENLKIQEELLFDLEKEIRDYEKQLKKTSKTDLAARKAINDKITKTKEKLNDERFGLKELNKERKKANEELQDSIDNSAEYSGVLGIVDQKTGGLISGIGGMTKSIGAATKGFNLMKIAIIGTGIGALLIAITSIGAAFTSTEEGQNKFNKIMGILGATVSVFTDRLATLGNFLISVFENPKQALIDFKDAFVENITNRVSSAIDTLGFLGSAIKKVFSGDFSGAMEDAKNAGTSYIDTMTGVKDTVGKVTESVKSLATEIVKEGKAAGKIADQRAAADKLDRKLIVERAEADRKRAELLEKSVDKEKFSTKERIEFLKEAGRLEEEITQKEIKASKLRLSAKQAENALGGSTKEDLEEEANLKATLIQLETARLGKQREITSQVIAFNAEALAADKAKADEEIANAKAVQDFKDSLRIKDKENKFAEIEAEKEARLLALEELKLSEEAKQQMILDVENAFKEKKKIIEAEEAEALAVEKEAFLATQLEEEELSLENKRQLALDELERFKGTEAEKAAINARYNALEAEQDKIKADAELAMAQQTFAGIANLLGQNSKAGKAAAVASALINTYQGITAELATKTATPWGFALKLVNIASVASIGFKSVKDIMKTNPKTSGGGGSAASPSYSSSTPMAEPVPPAPPAFNVVGASSTNQLADAIGGQSQQPIQTYVVANDVTSAQSLERNIVSGATID
jgi:hypothetical protein